MDIRPTSSDVAPSTAPRQLAGSDTMGKDEFLRLLVTQLSNQDPLNPMDGKDFAAQLAQFSSVEQLMNIGDVLAGNGEMNGVLAQSVNSGVAAGLIGKTVEAGGNVVGVDGSGEARLGVDLGSAAQEVTVTILDQSGNPVRTIQAGPFAAGPQTIAWDGRNDAGAAVPEGTYTFDVTARLGEEDVPAAPFTRGRVDRVSFGRDGIRLWIDGASVAMSDVRSVTE